MNAAIIESRSMKWIDSVYRNFASCWYNSVFWNMVWRFFISWRFTLFPLFQPETRVISKRVGPWTVNRCLWLELHKIRPILDRFIQMTIMSPDNNYGSSFMLAFPHTWDFLFILFICVKFAWSESPLYRQQRSLESGCHITWFVIAGGNALILRSFSLSFSLRFLVVWLLLDVTVGR